MKLEQRVNELEKKVAALEGRVPARQELEKSSPRVIEGLDVKIGRS